MSEKFWKHRFVEALYHIIRGKTGLGIHRCFDMAAPLADDWWKNKASYATPEAAAESAFQCLCE